MQPSQSKVSQLPNSVSAASHRRADRNLAIAVAAGRHKASRGPSSGAIEPGLTDIQYSPVTEATLAADKARDAAEKRATALAFAGFLTGRGYGRSELAEVLMALGIIPDPLSVSRPPKGCIQGAGAEG